jgi:hypothetical protein
MEYVCHKCNRIIGSSSEIIIHEISKKNFQKIIDNITTELYKIISIYIFLEEGNLLLVYNRLRTKNHLIYLGKTISGAIIQKMANNYLNVKTENLVDLLEDLDIHTKSLILDALYERAMQDGYKEKLQKK